MIEDKNPVPPKNSIRAHSWSDESITYAKVRHKRANRLSGLGGG